MSAPHEHWVLVVDSGIGQNRSALAAVRSLAAAGYRPAVTVSRQPALAAVSRYCHRTVLTPQVDSPDFAAAVRAEIASHPYLGVMPASDAALVALAAPEAEFVDKVKLAERAAQEGLRVPPFRAFESFDSLANAAPELDYPIVVKAALKQEVFYRPARRFTSPTDLLQLTPVPGPFIAQPFIPGEMHALVGVMWHGRLAASVHQRHVRIWPYPCGDACAAITTSPEDELQARLERLLAGYDGIFQAELAGDYLLDLNPRVYGSLPLAAAAGANLPGIYWDLVRGIPVEPVTVRAGARFHWWEGEARNGLARWRAGEISMLEAGRLLVGASGASAIREILDDPQPVLSRIGYASRLRQRKSRWLREADASCRP